MQSAADRRISVAARLDGAATGYLAMLPGAQAGRAILAGLIWLLLARWLAVGESRTRPATA